MIAEGRKDDYKWVARQLSETYSAESLRQVAHYRQPSWDLAFDLEVISLGAVSAHELRCWYREAA